jgi:hypothetical protein
MMKMLDKARDLTSVMSFKSSKMVDSSSSALVRFTTPDPSLASWEKGCGKIICTGFINVLINDRDGSLLGSVS